MEHVHDPQQLAEDPVSLALVGDQQDRCVLAIADSQSQAVNAGSAAAATPVGA